LKNFEFSFLSLIKNSDKRSGAANLPGRGYPLMRRTEDQLLFS